MLEGFPWKQPAQRHPIRIIIASDRHRKTPNLNVLAQQKFDSHSLKVQGGLLGVFLQPMTQGSSCLSTSAYSFQGCPSRGKTDGNGSGSSLPWPRSATNYF